MSKEQQISIEVVEHYTPGELIPVLWPQSQSFTTVQEREKLEDIAGKVERTEPLTILETQIIYQMAMKYLS